MPNNYNLQNIFLQSLVDRQSLVNVFLVNGIKLVGVIKSFNDKTLFLSNNASIQMVYKQAVASVLSEASLKS